MQVPWHKFSMGPSDTGLGSHSKRTADMVCLAGVSLERITDVVEASLQTTLKHMRQRS